MSSRRTFLQKAAGATLLASTHPQSLIGESHMLPAQQLEPRSIPSANDRLNVAVIGMGIMGFNNARTALKVPGVQLVAVADLYDGRRAHAQELFGKQVFSTRDYREILTRRDVDAVVVATSDHWHDQITIDALKAGKAVYCEKPMVHKIEEGHAVIKAEKETGKLLQIGSQRVSSIIYQKAKEIFESGELGKLIMAESWIDRQSANGAWQYSIPTDASPETVDWDRYLGDAPKMPFDKLRFFRWRNYQDYGTGVGGDLFVHLISGLHFVTSSLGPTRITATGGLRYWQDGRDVPDVLMANLDYPETPQHPAFNVQMRVNLIAGDGGSSLLRLVGSEGVLTIGFTDLVLTRSKMPEAPGYGGWDTFGTFTEAQQKAYEAWYHETYPAPKPALQGPQSLRFAAPEGYSDYLDHWITFTSAIRKGDKVIEDGSFGFRAAGPVLAANVSYFEQKIVEWDPKAMKVV